MKSYQTRSAWEDDYRLNVQSMTVMSQEPVEKFSGLYDANGNKLYVVERCQPVGFVHFGENS